MQELRFVGVEQGALIATSEDGTRFRIVIDEALRDALRMRPTVSRSDGPKVPPRVIQQMIRAGRTVDEVVNDTGADRELVTRFEGPILAERGYIVEQARAVAVRVQQQLDPLATDDATFGTAIDDRLEQLSATNIHWDAWRDLETGWHVGLNFVTDEVTRNALWKFDAKSHSLEAISPAAITLSQQGELPPLGGPHLRAVEAHRTDAVIPIAQPEPTRVDPFAKAASQYSTSNDTADLLEALARRRGERSPEPYLEEAEFGEDDLEDAFFAASSRDDLPEGRTATVTPFARAAATHAHESHASGESEHNPDDIADELTADTSAHRHDAERASSTREDSATVADGASTASSTEQGETVEVEARQPVSGVIRSVDVPIKGFDEVDNAPPAQDDSKPQRRGRMSMPSWDEIVFGTKSDDDKK